jgi:hypothetical protein
MHTSPNIQTVQQNYEGFTKHEVLQPKEARRVMGMIGNFSEEDFKGMVRGNMIQNCPVTPDLITNARTIFGPNLPSLQGKTVWQTPAMVVSEYVSVPREIVEQNKNSDPCSGCVFCRQDNISVERVETN